jgi:hypothetical protein
MTRRKKPASGSKLIKELTIAEIISDPSLNIPLEVGPVGAPVSPWRSCKIWGSLARWLELDSMNTANYRNMNMAVVYKYRDDMLAAASKLSPLGDWEDNGAPIIIGKDGTLFDGQKRIKARLLSGTEGWICLIYNVVSNNLGDFGQGRQVQDHLRANGYINTKILQAVARMGVQYDRGNFFKTSASGGSVRVNESYRYVDDNDEAIQACIGLWRSAQKRVSPANLIPTLLIGNEYQVPVPGGLAEWFCEGLGTGLGLTKADPVYWLRDKLINQTLTKKYSPYVIRMMTTKAWNKTIEGHVASSQTLALRNTGPRPTKMPTEILSCLEYDKILLADDDS